MISHCCFLIEKIGNKILLMRGKENIPDIHEDDAGFEYWYNWEEIESEEALFIRIKELLNK